MVHISDAELSILQSAFTKIKAALRLDRSPAAQNIMKGIIESEQIVKGKMGKDAAPIGGSVRVSKTKDLFEMFNLTQRVR
jgi:hypothetical protein